MLPIIIYAWLVLSVCHINCILSTCDVSYKVFVYPIRNELLRNAEEARQNHTFHVCKKCIYEQFALEYIIYDYFTQFCGRTHNPDEADYFYLPIIRDIDYRIALQTGQRAPSAIESALLDAIEKKDTTQWRSVFNVTDQFWLRHGGADHILVMPAPVTNLRHQSNMRGFFHYMIQLNSPIFLNVEFSRSFAEEYPICALQKNIVMPYPTTDSDFFSGRLFLPKYPHIKRDKLVFYQGGHHGSCEAVRSALVSIIKQKALALYWGDKKREAGFQSAAFCPIPVGDSPSSKRMYDVMNFGCIPVVLSDDLMWAFTTEHPTSTASHSSNGSVNVNNSMHINVTSFSLHLPQSIVQKTATYLLQHTVKDEGDVNYGRRLPSGTSLYELLVQLAAEEKTEMLSVANSTTNINSETTENNTNKRQLLVSEETQLDETILSSVLLSEDGSGLSKRLLVAKKPAVSAPGAISEHSVNTLVRLLQRVSAEDIQSLHSAVMSVAPSYRYYEFNTSLEKNSPALTATHTFPTGGAIRQLDRMLTMRKEKGIIKLNELCQAERGQKHKYIGRYPCEKRRKLFAEPVDTSNTDDEAYRPGEESEEYEWIC